MRHGRDASKGRLQSHVRAHPKSGKISGPMKVGFSGGWGACGEEDLLGRIQDKGRVELAGGSEVELLDENGKRNSGMGLPSVGGNFSGGDHLGERVVFFLKWNERIFKKAGPPSSVGGEIEFEVAMGVGSAEKELGNVVFPEFGLELPGAAFGVNCRRAFSRREEVKVGAIDPKEKLNGRNDRLSKPVEGKSAMVGLQLFTIG